MVKVQPASLPLLGQAGSSSNIQKITLCSPTNKPLPELKSINLSAACSFSMETLLGTAVAFLAPKQRIGNGYSFSGLFTPQKPSSLGFDLRKSLIVAAKQKNNNGRKKEDTHSFIPRPDETTGFFPEAVLLKERQVQGDGKLLPEFADAEEQELFEFLNLQLESDLKVERMRHYEVVYLIHEKHEEEVGLVNEKVQDFLREKKGRIWRLNDWGIRRLAYKIQKAKHAHYILMNFEMEAKWINDFKSMLDKDDRVIRHLVIKRDEAITEDCSPPPEFHTLRANMEDFDEEDDLDYNDAGEDEVYDEDWEGEDEVEGYNDDGEEGIIFVDTPDDEDAMEDINERFAGVTNIGRRNQRSEKFAR